MNSDSRSGYDHHDVLQSRSRLRFIGPVEQVVFTVPDEEVPVIFRVQPVIGPVFIRGDVRALFKQRVICGVAYKKPGTFSSTNQCVTDLPVK